MSPTKRKYFNFALLCLLGVVLLLWFGRKLDWREVRTAVSQANLVLLAFAALLICLGYLLRAYRWKVLLAPLGEARLSDLYVATTIGYGAVFLFGRAGEVVRPVILPMRDPRVRPSASFVTIIVERICDLTAVVVLFAVNLLWFKPLVISAEFARVRLAGVVLLVLVVGTLLGLAWFRNKSEVMVGWLKHRLNLWRFIPVRLSGGLIGMLEQLALALRVLVDVRELALTAAWTLIVWIGIAAANLLVLRAFGLPFGVGETIFVMGWSMVGSLVPTPGGAAGAFHAATAAGLIVLGVRIETAAAVSIVMHLINFGPALVVGFFYLIRGDVSFNQLRTLTSSEHTPIKNAA
jgi:uncharacterized protein (TIRG00374 family)